MGSKRFNESLAGMISELRSALVQPPKHPGPGVEILLRPADVVPFVGLVRSSADRERDALGFLPDAAYENAGSSGRLFVACRQEHGAPRFLGHLLFGGSFPHLRIHQLHVVPEGRKLGVARSLIDSLAAFAEQHGYMDITGEGCRRTCRRTPLGRGWALRPPGRRWAGPPEISRINVRVRQLEYPDTVWLSGGQAGLGSPDPKHVVSPAMRVYAIDLNVFFEHSKETPSRWSTLHR